ncbi:MAG: hypothetical protein EAZ09_20915, partial [Oscillatoriales cyanobacterium]
MTPRKKVCLLTIIHNDRDIFQISEFIDKKKEEGRRKKEEGRRKKEEGRRKKEEGRRKKEEG